ncbi:MAG: inositol-3-phosphate synthase [Desulfobacterales bacterium]|nr:inositol-3-phosphate synthase [Deltaproteobacteria bacterium]NNK96631.1 inositol-3-phosphate synthase [Desulfobacterales bacterium]
MKKIKIAIVGIGNCASALLQGLYYYRQHPGKHSSGLMNWDLGGYCPSDIVVAAAFDIDRRKVGSDVSKAIFQAPNCTTVFQPEVPEIGVTVQMGALLDGVPEHMHDLDPQFCFDPSRQPDSTQEAVVGELKNSGAQVLINYLPVGSQQATEFYMNCALEAGVAVVNCIPVFIASNPDWASRFSARGLPLIGDDVKSQMGATIVHRVLTDLFRQRGVELERTYQLNTGGNTDFLNMLDRNRLSSKKQSKTEAVQAVAAKRLADSNIHVGPSDYVPWQRDNKIGFIRMEGKIFGDVSIDLEMRLSVEDSPNSAGVVIDMIRCAQLALDRGQGGVLQAPSAFFCKHPPEQFTDDEAFRLVSKFISGPHKAPPKPKPLFPPVREEKTGSR